MYIDATNVNKRRRKDANATHNVNTDQCRHGFPIVRQFSHVSTHSNSQLVFANISSA